MSTLDLDSPWRSLAEKMKAEKKEGDKEAEQHSAPKRLETVNHPRHYTKSPSGVECIDVVEWLPFNVGNAIKYLWRSEHKNGMEDLRKALWYVQREIDRLQKMREQE